MFDVFFNDTATTEIYTLSLHDALPILVDRGVGLEQVRAADQLVHRADAERGHDPPQLLGHEEEEVDDVLGDRKSTRLNSSHANISYAVFCLKKKQFCLCLSLLHLLATA